MTRWRQLFLPVILQRFHRPGSAGPTGHGKKLRFRCGVVTSFGVRQGYQERYECDGFGTMISRTMESAPQDGIRGCLIRSW